MSEDLLKELERDLHADPSTQGAPAAPTSAITRWYLLKRKQGGHCLVVSSANIGDPPTVPNKWTIKWDSTDEDVVRAKQRDFCGNPNLC